MPIVSSKNMIAICHYGCEFDTNEDRSMSYYGGEAYVVDLDGNMQLCSFKQERAETIESTIYGMLVKYFLTGNKNNLINVSKDMHLHRRVNYYKESDQLEVFILKETQSFKTLKKNQLLVDLIREQLR